MTISNIEHQRIDDIPLLLAIMADMQIQAQIDKEIKPHGLWQGCSVGTIVVVWLSYILTEQDHRLEALTIAWAEPATPYKACPEVSRRTPPLVWASSLVCLFFPYVWGGYRQGAFLNWRNGHIPGIYCINLVVDILHW